MTLSDLYLPKFRVNFQSKLGVLCWNWTDLKGILREAKGRSGEQPKGAIAARSKSCQADYVHDCGLDADDFCKVYFMCLHDEKTRKM